MITIFKHILVLVSFIFVVTSSSVFANSYSNYSNLQYTENVNEYMIYDISDHYGTSGKKTKNDRKIRTLKRLIKNGDFQKCMHEILIEKNGDLESNLFSITAASNGSKVELRKLARLNYRSCQNN
ncbi:MAG: hypothetical protein P8K09_02905 [Hyphomicrobiales bacterium]|nr:hypothetical protein [Hyphomicrobiales bacterium]